MSRYEPSPRARSAIQNLLYAIEDERVPDTHLFAEDGLTPAYQRALAVLKACAATTDPAAPSSAPAVTAEPMVVLPRPAPDPQLVKPHRFPTLEQSVSTSPGVPSYEPPAATPAEAETRGGASVQLPENGTPAEPQNSEPLSLQKDATPAVPLPAPAASSLLTVKHSARIRNGRVGEAYRDLLELESGRDLKLVNAGRSGLLFDESDLSFAGTPEEAGDFEIILKGRIGDRLAEIVVHFSVNPDPKSLWKSFPSDQDAPFAKADEAFGVTSGEGLRMIAASKRGRSHARDAGFREDDFALAVHGAWHIAAVADGAGSAALSRRGSKLAVETAVTRLPALIDQHLGAEFDQIMQRHLAGEGQEPEIATRLYNTLVKAAFEAAEALAAEAERLNESVARLSTTLILVVARRIETHWFVAGFSIGDGGAAAFDLEGPTVHPLTAPDSGEYAGQTRFLARSEFADPVEAAKRLRYATPERFTAIALMSDGITDPKLPTDNAFVDPARWAVLWRDDLAAAVDFSADDATVQDRFLAWLDFWSPGNHDDRTLAVLLPVAG